ncbi:MAG: phytanoyl-CoA dioxygenase family protein [Alphaproteobacteria bacterium]
MSRDALAAIGDAEVDAFARDGAFCLRRVLDEGWLELLRRGVERNIVEPGPLHTVQTVPGEPGFFLSDICMAQQIPEFREFVLNGPAPAIAARLMGASHINFFADTLWVKDSGTEKRTRWHQDQPFFWVDGRQMCVVWFPLDPIARESALELVRGSHRWGKWFGPELSRDGRELYRDQGKAFERMPDIERERDKHDILGWAVEPGDCVAFHGLTVHGAPGNAGRGRRRAFSTVWMGDDARYAARSSAGRPHFEGHGLSPGDPMDCGYFPRVWPRAGRLQPASFARFTDPELTISK